MKTDQDLINAAAKGDIDAFETLYRRHRNWTYNLAHRFTNDHNLAQDVTQEVFTYLVKKIPTLKLTARMTTFLNPAVRNYSLTAIRKKKRFISPEDSFDELPAQTDSPDPNLDDGIPEHGEKGGDAARLAELSQPDARPGPPDGGLAPQGGDRLVEEILRRARRPDEDDGEHRQHESRRPDGSVSHGFDLSDRASDGSRDDGGGPTRSGVAEPRPRGAFLPGGAFLLGIGLNA